MVDDDDLPLRQLETDEDLEEPEVRDGEAKMGEITPSDQKSLVGGRKTSTSSAPDVILTGKDAEEPGDGGDDGVAKEFYTSFEPDETEAKAEHLKGLDTTLQKKVLDVIAPGSKEAPADILAKVDLKTLEAMSDALSGAPKTSEGKSLLALLGATPATAESTMKKAGVDTINSFVEAIESGQISQRTAENIHRVVSGTKALDALKKLSAEEIKSLGDAIGDRTLKPDQAKHLREVIENGGQSFTDAVKDLSPEALKNTVSVILDTEPETTRLRKENARPGGKGSDFGGHKYQRWLFGGLEEALGKKPASGGPSLAEQGWRIVATPSSSVADRAGKDFILLNTKTGQWLPLDVTEKPLDGAKEKTFVARFNSGIFDHDTGKVKPDTDLQKWLNDYIESVKDKAFNMSELPPLDLKPQPDPREKAKIIEDYGRQIEEQRTELRRQIEEERARPTPDQEKVEALKAKIEGLNALEHEQLRRAKGHVDRETAFQGNAVDGLSKYIKEHAVALRNSGTLPTTDTAPSADATNPLARKMVQVTGNEGTITGHFNDGTKPEDAKTLSGGDMAMAIDAAVDRVAAELNLSEAETRALRRNLHNADEALQRRLVDSIREEMSKSWEKLRTELAREKVALSKAAYQPETLVKSKDAKEVIDKVAEKALDKRFEIVESKGKLVLKEVESGKGTYSLADILRGDPKEMKQLETEARTSELRNIRGSAFDSFKKSLSGLPGIAMDESLTSLAGLPKVDKAELAKLLGKIEINTEAGIKPGESKVVFTHNRRVVNPVSISGDTVTVTDTDGKNPRPVKVSDLAVEIKVSPNSDASTLQTDVALGVDEVLRRVTAEKRRPKTMNTEEFAGNELVARDQAKRELEQAQRQRLKPLIDEAKAVAGEYGYNWPPGSHQEAHELLSAAIESLKDKKATPGQLEEYNDFAKRFVLESEAGEGGAVDMARELFQGPQRGRNTGDGLWHPQPVLDKEAAVEAAKKLSKHPASPLANAETMKKFLEATRAELSAWDAVAGIKSNKAGKLAQEILNNSAALEADARELARRALPDKATAEEISKKAQSYLEGKETPPGEAGERFTADRQRLTEQKKTHGELQTELRKLSSERAARLEQVANKFGKELGLPEIKIIPVEHLDTQAAYRPGTGEVFVPVQDLINRPEAVVDGLYHEMVHVQQEALVLRSLADKHKIDAAGAKPAEREAKIAELIKEYTEDGKRELNREVLDQVLKQRLDEGKKAGLDHAKPLDEQHRQKANALFESFKQNKPIATEYRELGNSYRVTQARLNFLTGAEVHVPAAQDLVAQLASGKPATLAERLFGSTDRAKWPAEIRDLVSNWEKADKDPGTGRARDFNEMEARDVLKRSLGERLTKVNERRQEIHKEYIEPLFEQEAHLTGRELLAERVKQGLAGTEGKAPATTETKPATPPKLEKGATVRVEGENWKITMLDEKAGQAVIKSEAAAKGPVSANLIPNTELETKYEKVTVDGDTYYKLKGDKEGRLYKESTDLAKKPGRTALALVEGMKIVAVDKLPVPTAPTAVLVDRTPGFDIKPGQQFKIAGESGNAQVLSVDHKNGKVLVARGEAGYGKTIKVPPAELATKYVEIKGGEKGFYYNKETGKVYEGKGDQLKEMNNLKVMDAANVKQEMDLQRMKGDVPVQFDRVQMAQADAAGKAMDRFLGDAVKEAKAVPVGEKGLYKFAETMELRFGEKVMKVSAVEVLDGKVYLRTEDGQRHSAEPWLDLARDGLKDRQSGKKSTVGEKVAATETLRLMNASVESKVAVLQSLVRNYAAESAHLPKVAFEAQTASLVKPVKQGGAGGGSGGPVVATGGADIKPGAGGYEVVKPGTEFGAFGSEGRHDLTREEMAKVRKEIVDNKEGKYTAEQQARALRVLEMAEKGHPEAQKALREALGKAKGEGGGFDKATGTLVGIGIIVLTLAGWYAYSKMKQAQEPYVPPAAVR